MDRTAKGNNQAPPVDPGRKWLRLQEFGLALWLAIPFVTVLKWGYAPYLGWSTGSDDDVLMVFLMVVMAAAGLVCLEVGEGKRRALRRNSKEVDHDQGTEV